MKITRTSPVSGSMVEMDIDVTLEQLEEWRSGVPIQKAMPNVPAPLREFILTGTTPEEWEMIFRPDDEEE